MTKSILDDLHDVDRSELIAASRRRRFGRNEVLFHEHDPGDSLHLLTRGFVAIRATTELGETVTLGVLGPGQTFGELALLTPESLRTASVVALESVETLSWHRGQVEELRGRSSEFDRFLLEMLAEQVSRLNGLLVEAMSLPVERRVLRRLSSLAELYAPDEDRVPIPITQEDLATMAGTTRPSVNRVLKEAAERSLVELSRGRIVVLDRVGLAARAGH